MEAPTPNVKEARSARIKTGYIWTTSVSAANVYPQRKIGIAELIGCESCDDENPCTTDTCVDGTCVHTPKDCDDENPCTIDSCVDGQCVNTPVPAPTAAFSGTPTSGCKLLPVQFTDLSTGSVTSWSWAFGDGGTSTLRTHPTPTPALAATP